MINKTSDYGKMTNNNILSFGSTQSDNTSSINSSSTNLIQTSIIPKGLGLSNSSTNSIQLSKIICSNSKKGVYATSSYTTNALSANTDIVLPIDFDFTTSNTGKYFYITSDISIILKIDSAPLSGVPNLIYTSLHNYKGCVSHANTTTDISTGTPASKILTSLFTRIAFNSTEVTTGTYALTVSASLDSSTYTPKTFLTFLVRSPAAINYSIEIIANSEITSTDINI